MIPTKSHVIDSFPSPTLDEIKRFESLNRIFLPNRYVAFLRASNGGSFDFRSALVGPPSLPTCQSIVLLYGLNAQLSAWDLQEASTDKELLYYPKLKNFLPIGVDPFGNQFCLQVTRPGLFGKRQEDAPVWLLDHETGKLELKLASSFNDFLDGIYSDPDQYQETSPVCKLIEEGRIDELKSLLSKNEVDFDEVGKNNDPLLTLAAWNRRPAICRLLLDAGFDVNKRGRDGLTALHLTMSVDVIRLLIEADANIEAKSDGGETPLMRNLKYHYTRPALELLKHGARVDEVSPELLNENPDVAKFVREKFPQ